MKADIIHIKLVKARTCEGCRASESRNECSIGYQCKNYIPLERCPKPKTIRQLIEAGKIKEGCPLTQEQALKGLNSGPLNNCPVCLISSGRDCRGDNIKPAILKTY